MAAVGVRIEGLAELRRELRRVENVEGLADVRKALKSGAEIVAMDARSRVPVLSGRARGSIRATAAGNRAFVKGGGKRVPYYPWLEFGGRVGRGGNVFRARAAEGRYLFPATARNRQRVIVKVSDGLRAAIRKAGL